MAQFKDGEKWSKATGAALDGIMSEGRTARRLQASERTMEKARARSAQVRALREQKESRDYAANVRKVLRDLGLTPGANAWGKTFRVKVRKASERKAGAQKQRSIRPSAGRIGLPKYRKAIRDSRGRVAVFLQMSYLGLKSKGWRPGLPADHAKYCQRADALEDPAVQLDRPISNVAETPAECVALWKAVEPVEQGYRANAKVQFRFVGSLPHTLTSAQRRDVVQEFADQALGRYGLGYTAFIHLPDEKGDSRNYHFHLLATLRPVARLGDHEWAISEEKLTEPFTPEGLKRIRAIYAAVVNRQCRKAELDERYTHQTYQERGIDAFRTEKIGPARMAAHEAGEDVTVIERNQARIEVNEAGVEVQFWRRKLDLQDAKATALKKATKAARAVRRFAEMQTQIEAIRRKAEQARQLAHLRPVRLNDELRDAVHAIAQHASSAASLLPARQIEPEYKDTISHIARRAQTVTSYCNSRLPIKRHRNVAPALKPILSRITAASERAFNSSSKSMRAPDLRLGGGMAAIIRRASLAERASVPQRTIGEKVRERIKSVSARAHAALKIERQPVGQPIVEDARRTVGRVLSIADRRKTQSPRRIPPSLAEKPTMIDKSASLVPSAPRSVQLDRDDLAKITASRALSAEAPIREPTVRPIDPNPPRVMIDNIVHPPPPQRDRADAKNATTGKPLRREEQTEARTTQSEISGSQLAKPATGNAADAGPMSSHQYSALASLDDDPRAVGFPTRDMRPLDERVAVFADAMRRNPSGLVMWDDGSVRPTLAFADSWGLSKADLGTHEARGALLPLYVDQELRLGRLEIEMKWFIDSPDELLDPDMEFRTKLSKEARETIETYDRSRMLYDAVNRVHREAWLGLGVEGRKQKMERRKIDWRGIKRTTLMLPLRSKSFGSWRQGIGL